MKAKASNRSAKKHVCKVLVCALSVIALYFALFYSFDDAGHRQAPPTTVPDQPHLPSSLFTSASPAHTNVAGNNQASTSYLKPTTPPPPAYILRPDGRAEGGHVRVLIAMMATKMDPIACMGAATGFLAGIPVTIIGHNPNGKYSHMNKPKWILEAARKAGLTSKDVIFYVDADIMFNSRALLLGVIDRFIAESAESVDMLDPLAVREGRVRPPIIVSRESLCVTPQLFNGVQRICRAGVANISNQYTAYARAHNITQFVKHFSYLNAGTMLMRMWALEEFLVSFDTYVQLNPKDQGGWYCDQSVVYALYLDTRLWEMREHVLLMRPAIARQQRSDRYGMLAGLIDADERNELSLMSKCRGGCTLSNELWIKKREEASTKSSHASTASRYSIRGGGFKSYTEAIYADYHGKLERVALPRLTPQGYVTDLYNQTGDVFIVDVLPPLVIVPHNGKVLLYGVPARAAPAIVHLAGGMERYMKTVIRMSRRAAKFARIADNIHYMPWYIPMRSDTNRLLRAKNYLAKELRLTLLSNSKHEVVSYKEVCMDALRPQEPINKNIYAFSANAYDLFFDYKQ